MGAYLLTYPAVALPKGTTLPPSKRARSEDVVRSHYHTCLPQSHIFTINQSSITQLDLP